MVEKNSEKSYLLTAFYNNFTTFDNFEKFPSFFKKKTSIFSKEPKFRTFGEMLLFQLPLTAKFINLMNKKIHIQNRLFRHVGGHIHSDVLNWQVSLKKLTTDFPSIL